VVAGRLSAAPTPATHLVTHVSTVVPTVIPTLRTERLLLRAFAEADFEAYAAMVADPEVTRHLADGRPLGRADAWRQMAMFAGHWALRGFGVWAVEERATGAFIGRIGCFHPEGWPGFEVAYTLARGAWGRGYAREGAAASLRWAHEVLGRRGVISVIRPANVGSIRVATALGAVEDGAVDFYGGPALIYRYPDAG
jgi:RimJ/RimL family protein N-acetyltransferase